MYVDMYLHIIIIILTPPPPKKNIPKTHQKPHQTAGLVPTLHLTVLDTVSARVLHRLTHFHAAGPVKYVYFMRIYIYFFFMWQVWN